MGEVVSFIHVTEDDILVVARRTGNLSNKTVRIIADINGAEVGAINEAVRSIRKKYCSSEDATYTLCRCKVIEAGTQGKISTYPIFGIKPLKNITSKNSRSLNFVEKEVLTKRKEAIN